MADPDHVPDLDDFDRTTVQLYRASLAVGAAAILLAGAVYAAGGMAGGTDVEISRGWLPLIWTLLAYGTGACVMNLHLYDRRIRWYVNGFAWLGVVLMLSSRGVFGQGLGFWLEKVGIGFMFATWSAVALKEQFCFKLPFMRLVPWFLGASLAPMCADMWLPSGLLLIASAALLTLLASAKQRQPLHYDIGDKSRYEI